jgi:uroporphyrinogen decarboxylase
MPLANERLLRALRREPVDRPPIWLMRQAGRYLPEYRKTRERAGSFLMLCKTPELCCEVALQPLARYALDASIVFSDILTIPDAMGLELDFVDGEGPMLRRVIASQSDVERLGVPDPGTDLHYVMEAVRVTAAALGGRIPLIGFAGSPWTLAVYMVEGRGGTDYQQVRRMRFDAPELLDRLIDVLVRSVCVYLEAQAHAGASVLMLFDTWAGILDADGFERYSGSPIARIATYLNERVPGVPLIAFCKGAGPHLAGLARSGCAALGVDWTLSLRQARELAGSGVALQGNLDPLALLAAPARIREATRRVLEDYGPGPGHVFNLGHGIVQQTPPEHIEAAVEAVHAFRSVGPQ